MVRGFVLSTCFRGRQLSPTTLWREALLINRSGLSIGSSTKTSVQTSLRKLKPEPSVRRQPKLNRVGRGIGIIARRSDLFCSLVNRGLDHAAIRKAEIARFHVNGAVIGGVRGLRVGGPHHLAANRGSARKSTAGRSP